MKAISPIVATVLLIAITMTIAGVLAYWSSQFVTQGLPGVNETNIQCNLAQFEFLSCSYNTTSQVMVFSLNNLKKIDLSNLTAYIQYSNNTIGAGISLNQTLTGNTVKSYSISGISSDFTTLLIKTNCPELSRSITCARS